MKIVALLLSGLLVAAPATAQDAAPRETLSLAIGETVTVRVTTDGRFVELSRMRRPISAPSPAPDTISFSFFDLSGTRSLLNSSGYGEVLTYRNRAFVGDRVVANEVCPTVPGFALVQTWGEPVDRIELSEPHVVAERASPVPSCG